MSPALSEPSWGWKNGLYHKCPSDSPEQTAIKGKRMAECGHYLPFTYEVQREGTWRRSQRESMMKGELRSPEAKAPWSCVRSSSFRAQLEEPGLPSPRSKAGSRIDKLTQESFSLTRSSYYTCPLPKIGRISVL